MVLPSDITRALRGTGLPGSVTCLGLFGVPFTDWAWPDERAKRATEIFEWVTYGGVAWFVLIAIGRLTDWRPLRRLELGACDQQNCPFK